MKKFGMIALSTICASHLMAESESVKLSEVTVTSASGFEQNIKDAPATITVISAEEIHNKSYSDITDVLKNVPGVSMSGGSVDRTVRIRGMDAGYTLFLIDGRPAQGTDGWNYNGQNNGTQAMMLPPLEQIERIEVVRGPASGLYGSDAMGGVINIITKKVSNEWTGSITQEYIKADSNNKVNNDSFNTNVNISGPIIPNVLGLQLGGSFNKIDESNYQSNGGGNSGSSDPDYKRVNINSKLTWKIDDQNSLTAGGSYTKEDKVEHSGISLVPTRETTFRNIVKGNYFLTHEGSYGNLLLNSYFNYDYSKFPTTRSTVAGMAKGVKFNTITLNSQATYMLDSHTITGGATYKKEDLKNGATAGANSLNPTGYVEMERYQASVFLEDEWRILEDLALTVSGRYDHNEAFGSHFSPKAYLVYHLTDEITLKGGVLTGYKAPSLMQSSPEYSGSSNGGTNVGNPNLKPETSLSYEFGVDYDNRDIGLKGSVVAFKNDFKDKITRTGFVCDPSATPGPCTVNGIVYDPDTRGYRTYENVDKVELKGLEITADYQILDNLSFRQSYTYTKSEQKTGDSKGLPLNSTPKHMYNAGLDYDYNAKLRLWTQYNYVGEGYAGVSRSTGLHVYDPKYSFIDIGAVYRATKNLTLRFGVYNVMNEKVSTQDEYTFNLDGRRYSAAFTYSF